MLEKEGEEYNKAVDEIEFLDVIMEGKELSDEEDWSLVENKKIVVGN